jgi:hypothetical protein
LGAGGANALLPAHMPQGADQTGPTLVCHWPLIQRRPPSKNSSMASSKAIALAGSRCIGTAPECAGRGLRLG